jgi:hypothetical protein
MPNFEGKKSCSTRANAGKRALCRPGKRATLSEALDLPSQFGSPPHRTREYPRRARTIAPVRREGVSAGPGFRRRRAEHGVRGFPQPLDEFHDPGSYEVALGGALGARGAHFEVMAAPGLSRPAGRWATESPAIRAVPSSMLSTSAGKKFIAGKPMNPTTNTSLAHSKVRAVCRPARSVRGSSPGCGLQASSLRFEPSHASP